MELPPGFPPLKPLRVDDLIASRELTQAARLAFGWLWHITTDDPRIIAARRALSDALDMTARGDGINQARQAGAEVDVREMLAVDAHRTAKPT